MRDTPYPQSRRLCATSVIMRNNISLDFMRPREHDKRRASTTARRNEAITWKNKAHKKINIDVYIKRFFSNEFVFLTTYTADSVPWQIPQDLKPGEYQFKLQALSDEFENSDIEVQNLLIKPQQKDFKPQF